VATSGFVSAAIREINTLRAYT